MIFLGYYSNTDVLKIVGYLFIFVLGTTLAGITGDGIQYHAGDTITNTGLVSTVAPIYTYYTNHTLGLYTSIVALLGFISVYVQYKGGIGEDD